MMAGIRPASTAELRVVTCTALAALIRPVARASRIWVKRSHSRAIRTRVVQVRSLAPVANAISSTTASRAPATARVRARAEASGWRSDSSARVARSRRRVSSSITDRPRASIQALTFSWVSSSVSARRTGRSAPACPHPTARAVPGPRPGWSGQSWAGLSGRVFGWSKSRTNVRLSQCPAGLCAIVRRCRGHPGR